jgi:hypothetical protein
VNSKSGLPRTARKLSNSFHELYSYTRPKFMSRWSEIATCHRVMRKYLNGSLKSGEKQAAGWLTRKLVTLIRVVGQSNGENFNVTDHHHGTSCEPKALSASLGPASPRSCSCFQLRNRIPLRAEKTLAGSVKCLMRFRKSAECDLNF